MHSFNKFGHFFFTIFHTFSKLFEFLLSIYFFYWYLKAFRLLWSLYIARVKNVVTPELSPSLFIKFIDYNYP